MFGVDHGGTVREGGDSVSMMEGAEQWQLMGGRARVARWRALAVSLAVRTALVAATVAVALSVPRFAYVMAFTGTLPAEFHSQTILFGQSCCVRCHRVRLACLVAAGGLLGLSACVVVPALCYLRIKRRCVVSQCEQDLEIKSALGCCMAHCILCDPWL